MASRTGSVGPAALLALVALQSAAAPTDLKIRRLANGLEARSSETLVRIMALRDDIIRVRIGRGGRFPEDASWAALPAARAHRVPVKAYADAAGAGFRTAAVDVHLDRTTGSLAIKDSAGRVLLADATERPLTLDARGFTLRKDLEADTHIFGLGDKAGLLDRRGQAFALWNTDAVGWQEATDPLYKSIPFFIGADERGRSFGVFLDNTWRTSFDFGRTDRRMITIGAEDGPIDYYVFAGPDPKQVVRAYAWLTGPPPMPPLWALGFQQSRWSYMNDAEVRGIAARLRSERIPADAIYLDIDYQDRNRPFTVNKAAFPDLPALTRDLKADGFHLVAITDLHIADAPNQGYVPYDTGVAGDHFLKAPGGGVYVGEVWPGPSVFPDFTRSASRAWWGGLYRSFLADGVSGFWNDMNEPVVFGTPGHSMPLDTLHRIDEPGFVAREATHAEIHNIYGMQNSRGTYEGLLALAPTERPFVLTRASFAGGQRYAATWTGDNDATWNHLKLSVPMIENLGLSGFAWSGADVGGFSGSPSPELLTRWIEVAAFTPLFRDHASKGTRPHEPWVDGPEHTAIRRRFIEARYRLMPYLYALADEAAATGVPIMRPLFLEFPAAVSSLRETSGEFMLGPDLIIAPQPGGETLDAYDARLPGQGWFDYWTGLPVAASRTDRGDEVVKEHPSLGRLPVFVRSGSILPRQPVVQSTGQRPDGPLELDVYPGPDCQGQLYWDDGHSLDTREALRQTVSCRLTPQGVTIAFEPRRGSYPPWWATIDVVVHGWLAGSPTARLNGAEVTSTFARGEAVARVTIGDQAGPAELTIR